MRRFTDESGEVWETAVGRESWGTFVILFTPAAGGLPRKSLLGAETMLEAQLELDALTAEQLRERLGSSEPWE